MKWYLWQRDGIYSISNFKPEDAMILLEGTQDDVFKKMMELTGEEVEDQDDYTRYLSSDILDPRD